MNSNTWIEQRRAERPEVVARALQAYRDNAEHVQMASAHEYSRGDSDFGLWLALVNRRALATIGLTFADLADWTWRDAYDDGMSPNEAFGEALAADDTYQALVGGAE